jgi:hypothetical protein
MEHNYTPSLQSVAFTSTWQSAMPTVPSTEAISGCNVCAFIQNGYSYNLMVFWCFVVTTPCHSAGVVPDADERALRTFR